MKIIKDFIVIVDAQTVIISILTVIATYLCVKFGFHVKLPTGLIGIAIIFPIVFSINSAYRRREETLKFFASLKAHSIALFYAHRDWSIENPTHAIRARKLIENLLNQIREYFVNADDLDKQLTKVYSVISDFSLSHEKLRKDGVPGNEISRANQYLRAIIIEFERMRNIMLYRTPKSLRAYSQIFLNLFPVLFAPYFAVLCEEHSLVGYAVAVLYSVILVSLDNIQQALENPYDEVGLEDVKLDVAQEYINIMKC